MELCLDFMIHSSPEISSRHGGVCCLDFNFLFSLSFSFFFYLNHEFISLNSVLLLIFVQIFRNVRFLLSRPLAAMPYERGYEEDKFIQSLEPLNSADIELLASNCTEVRERSFRLKLQETSTNQSMKKIIFVFGQKKLRSKVMSMR